MPVPAPPRHRTQHSVKMGRILQRLKAVFAHNLSRRRRAEAERDRLLKKLENLHHALDAATLYTLTNTNDVILEANDRFCQACGYSREELIGKTHRLLNSGYHPRSLFKEMWETILAGRVWRGEVMNRAKDGSLYWADSIIVPLLDRKGRTERFIALRTLITGRKQAEADLLKREAQLEQLAKASRELNRDLDLPVVMRRLVETGVDLAGATAGTYALLEGASLCVREYFRNGRWESVHFTFAPGQGIPGWVMATGQSRICADARQDPQVQQEALERFGLRNFAALPIHGRKGEYLGYFGIHNKAEGSFQEADRALLEGLAAHAAVAVENARWVEALRQEKEALRQSEAWYRTLVDQLHEGLAQTDPLGHITYANPRLARMLGYQEGELTELDFPIQSSQDRAGALAGLPGPDGTPWRGVYEARLQRKDGLPLEVLISESPLQDEAGNVLGGLVLISDNTDHKQAEEMFRQAQKAESLARMAGGIAHDFNNLFQGLLGHLELARDHLQDPGRIAATLDRCLQILARAAALSTRMLEASGKGFILPEAVQLGALIRRHEDLLRGMVGPGCRLSFQLEDAELCGDAQQLLKVAAGLISNAEEAARDGQVDIRVFAGRRCLEAAELAQGIWPEPVPAGDYAVLSVEDDGCGIDPRSLGKVFDPFFSTKAPGRGLGLCSTLGIVRAHRGGLQILSAHGKGTRVRIFFPPGTGPVMPAPIAAPAPPAVSRRKTVLLVDDDPDLRMTLREVLEQVLGCTVLVAKCGPEGVEAFRAQPDAVDLILMDASMPGMCGWEAFERIRQIRPAARALLCSGFSGISGEEQAREHGFLGYLKKPFSIRALQEAFAMAMGQEAGGTPTGLPIQRG